MSRLSCSPSAAARLLAAVAVSLLCCSRPVTSFLSSLPGSQLASYPDARTVSQYGFVNTINAIVHPVTQAVYAVGCFDPADGGWGRVSDADGRQGEPVPDGWTELQVSYCAQQVSFDLDYNLLVGDNGNERAVRLSSATGELLDIYPDASRGDTYTFGQPLNGAVVNSNGDIIFIDSPQLVANGPQLAG